MPSFDEAMAERVAQELVDQKKRDAQEREGGAAQIALLFGQYDRLLCNDDFQWWLKEVVAPKTKSAHDAALDVKLSPSDRNDFAHQHKALSDLVLELQREHTRLGNILAAAK